MKKIVGSLSSLLQQGLRTDDITAYIVDECEDALLMPSNILHDIPLEYAIPSVLEYLYGREGVMHYLSKEIRENIHRGMVAWIKCVRIAKAEGRYFGRNHFEKHNVDASFDAFITRHGLKYNPNIPNARDTASIYYRPQDYLVEA